MDSVVLQVDGQQVDPVKGASYVGGKLRVMMNGMYARAQTDFGLAVENDGHWTAVVKMSGSFSDMTDGLCGNNNGDPEDDLITKDGEDMNGNYEGHSIFGNSWEVYDPEDPRYSIV